MYEMISTEDVGQVRVITLNRPRVLNAINKQMRAELTDALGKANQEDGVRCVMLTGAGDRAFAAGQDLSEAMQFSPERARVWIDEFDQVFAGIRNLNKASVAALNGYAVGAAFQIALLCDIRIASDQAKVGMPEINDAIPCITGTWTLWDVIGRSRTVELVLTGRLIDAHEAKQWGIIHQTAPHGELRPAALAMAKTLASKPRTATRLNKERWRLLTQAAADDAREFAKNAHATAFASGEPRAAMEAFLAKRRAKS